MPDEKFVQIVTVPAVPDFHPFGLFALDAKGVVWEFEHQHKVWVSYPTTRAVKGMENL